MKLKQADISNKEKKMNDNQIEEEGDQKRKGISNSTN